MMRYQDNLPLSNGRRSHWRNCKEEEGITSIKEIDDVSTKTIPTFLQENKGVPRFKSPSPKTQDHNFSPVNTTLSHSGDDILLQWGQRKRSRCSRAIESRAAAAAGQMLTTDDSSSSSSTQIQAMVKVPKTSVSQPILVTSQAGLLETRTTCTKFMSAVPISITAATNTTTTTTSIGKSENHKSCNKDTSAFKNRSLEERPGGGSGSQPPRNGCGSRAGATAACTRSKVGLERSSPKRKVMNDHKINGLRQQEQGGGLGKNHISFGGYVPLQDAGCSTTTTHDDHTTLNMAVVATEKAVNGGGGGVNEWPRICIPLKRKEKEEDFLAMKGTKLPYRPKKRPKAVEKMLQYCFPGMWLSDVTRTKYEVKEKKCTTKKTKQRGLKGMENMDGDSE